MRKTLNKDRFIPLRKTDLIKACCEDGDLSESKQASFKSLCHILSSTLHFEFHHILETLKDNYAPFDPNADTLLLETLSEEQVKQKQSLFSQAFTQVLNAANYEQVTDQDLQEAMTEESLFKVRLMVEFDDFEQVVFYRRGEYLQQEQLSTFWGLRKQQIEFTNYDRVAVFIKFKQQAYFTAMNKPVENFEPGSTIIKLFQNVPKADLEMLFPNSQVRMRPIDKFIIGASAAVGGTIVLVTKLGVSLLLVATLLGYWLGLRDQEVQISSQQLIALGLGMGVFGSFIFKEWSKFKNRKLKFMKALADNLYFKNLDNNAGVFHHLIDAAEEEESKESILAYYFLLISPEPITAEQLDIRIETWFAKKYDFHIDFEIEDALRKLLRFGLIRNDADLYTVTALEQAQEGLNHKWNHLFD
jgi:hypothetical protein